MSLQKPSTLAHWVHVLCAILWGGVALYFGGLLFFASLKTLALTFTRFLMMAVSGLAAYWNYRGAFQSQ